MYMISGSGREIKKQTSGIPRVNRLNVLQCLQCIMRHVCVVLYLIVFVFYRMLQEDPVLFQLYKDLVVSQVISAEEFWANRLGGINNAEPTPLNDKQEVGISGAFLVSTYVLAGVHVMLPVVSYEGQQHTAAL